MLALVSAVLFVIGAFAADDNKLFDWPWQVWLLLGLAAWVLSGPYRYGAPGARR
jgi:peptidoglycan/LPS O-acetylase OafA/YrhL